MILIWDFLGFAASDRRLFTTRRCCSCTLEATSLVFINSFSLAVQFKLRKDLAVSDIMFVDSPGMIDSPESPSRGGPVGAAQNYDRGYDFARFH